MRKTSNTQTRRTILLVEDQVVVRMIVSDYLRECDFKVIEAAEANEALIVLQQVDITTDILLCHVPVTGTLGGFSLAKWARENRPGIAVKLTGTPRRAAMAAVELCDAGRRKDLPTAQSLISRMMRLAASVNRAGTRTTKSLARGESRSVG